jgi:hypothetical protein
MSHQPLVIHIFVLTSLLVILTLAPEHSAAAEVHRRSLAIHGPFGVNSADLDSASTGGTSVPDDPHLSDLAGKFDLWVGEPPGRQTGEPSGPQTPTATRSFEASATLNGIDPGIAVGNSYILVSDNENGVAVYDKAGKLLGPKSGTSAFPNPFTVRSLFSQVKTDIDPLLNYPSGLPPGFTVAEGEGIKGYGDIRVMFDAYRKRFWIYARAKNRPPWDPKTIVNYPAVKLARRQKAVVAVSKTEDPRDGFYTYWWNETINNGSCNDPTGCSDSVFKVSGEGADYPSIGISPKYFLATVGVNRRDPAFETATEEQAKAWTACNSSFVADGQTFNWCGPFYIHAMVVDADILAKGCPRRLGRPIVGKPVLRCPAGRSFGLFVNAKNYLTDRDVHGDFAHDSSLAVRPVVMHGPQVETQFTTTVHSADAYFVNTFIDRREPGPHFRLVLWSLVGDDLIPTIYHISPFRDDWSDKWNNVVLNASYRNGSLYATFNECWAGVVDGCLRVVRVVRVNTLKSETEIDGTFGLNQSGDKPFDSFHYRFPGIEVTKQGDIVVVFSRFSTDTSQWRQEVRFSVWYHNESDIRPSRSLHAGEAVGAWVTDTAGIAVDPSNENRIWIAHIFAAKDTAGQPYRRIAVGAVEPRRSLVIKRSLEPKRSLKSRQ